MANVPAEPTAPLTKGQALKLTAQIKRTLEHVEDGHRELRELARTAKEGRVWEPLGFATWEAWVEGEIGLSRGSGYRLVYEATVIKELEAVAGVTVDMSQRAALDLVPILAEVSELVAKKVRGKPRASRKQIVQEVVDQARRGEGGQVPDDVSRRDTSTPPDQPEHPSNSETLTNAESSAKGTGSPAPEQPTQPEQEPPEPVGSSVVAALLASDPEAEAEKDTSAQGIEYATEGFRWFGSYEMKAKGVTSLRTPAGTTPGTKQEPKLQTPTSEGGAVQTQPDRQPDALSLGEQAKAFLRTLDATPADDYAAEDWRKFNRNFASKVFRAIKAKTDALEKKAKK